MKNNYEIRGEVTAIFLKRRDGTVFETLVDTNDLARLQAINGTIFSKWHNDTRDFRAMFSLGKEKKILLHRIILNAPPGLQVDHINHNALDNRQSNLRIVTNSENAQNKIGANRSNRFSRSIGVYWHSRDKAWAAKIKINYKDIWIGYFDKKEDAEKAVFEARAKLMPFSQEAMESHCPIHGHL